jgi:hypothetical protein
MEVYEPEYTMYSLSRMREKASAYGVWCWDSILLLMSASQEEYHSSGSPVLDVLDEVHYSVAGSSPSLYCSYKYKESVLAHSSIETWFV